jgi:hypothetical protein
MNIEDPISESLETVFWVQILKFFDKILKFFDAGVSGIRHLFDPGSRIPGWRKFGSEINIPDP